MKKNLFIFALLLAALAPAQVQARNLQIITRQQWGADENLTLERQTTPQNQTQTNGQAADAEERSEPAVQDPDIEQIVEQNENGIRYIWPLQYAREIKFIVIHYTAVTNNLDNPTQDIRNIYHSHAAGRGWGDIGYNYLIDRQGRVYEGRKGGEKVIGGHALPVNKVSIGIALMGNYNDEELPAPMLDALIKLLDEKTRLYDIDPLGRTEHNGRAYDNIHGHEDNSAKLDPGFFGRQKAPLIRQLLAYKQGRIQYEINQRYNFSLLSPKNVVAVQPDIERRFTIRLKNKGAEQWGPDAFLKNTSDNSLPRVFARMQNSTAAPNGIAEFAATFPASLISGMRLPVLNLVINNDVQIQKPLPLAIQVEGLHASYEIVGAGTMDFILRPGQEARTWISLKNTGNFTWRRGGRNPMRIGTARGRDHFSALFNLRNRISRLKEPGVAPGQIGTFEFTLKAPRSAGTYSEYFQPLVENAVWLPDQSMRFTVEVRPPEKPLRVALGFDKRVAKIKSESGMRLYSNGGLRRTFAENELVRVRLLDNGGYSVSWGARRMVLNNPPRFKAKNRGILQIENYENRPAWNQSLNDNLFRGTLEIHNVDNALTVINELPLENYLKGSGEVSNGDPPEKIKTIIILARSYARYYRDIARKFPGKPYDLDDNPNNTQKYVGYGLELRSPNITAAVAETNGKIVTYQGRPIITPYFSQSDGRTRSAQEVWGWTDAPWLAGVEDNFCDSTELRGHGVGLSGCGATTLARQGKTAEEIIKYYYLGVEISDGR